MKHRIAALAVCGLVVAQAGAAEVESIKLFGRTYSVQRFNYLDEVQFEDPKNPGEMIGPIEIEGAHWLGDNHLLISTDELDALGSYKNFILEIELTADAQGTVTGLGYVRTVVISDPFPDFLGGLGHAFDLDPGGVTVNTSGTGLAAGGDLLISDTELEGIRGYRFDPLGGDPTDEENQLEWPPGSGCLEGEDPGLECGIEVEPHNVDTEDLAYVHAHDLDLIYTIRQELPYRMVVFTTEGEYQEALSFPVAGGAAAPGEPKGLTYLPDVPAYPGLVQGVGGTLIVALDDENPGLQVFDLDGNELAYEPLTDTGTPDGTTLLGADILTGQLQLESLTSDPQSGRLILVNQGEGLNNNVLWVLTPVISGDFDDSGGVDLGDHVHFVECLAGPNAMPAPPAPTTAAECLDAFDFDLDGDVDLGDFDDFQARFGV